MKVRSYGKLADFLGPERAIEMPEHCTVGDVRSWLANEFPDAAVSLASRRVQTCVGDRLVPDDYVLRPEECVDLLPPVSGG